MSFSTYKATRTGEVWLFVDEKKKILMESFYSEVDAARCAMLLNELLPKTRDEGFDAGYQIGYDQGYLDRDKEAEIGNV